MSAVPNPLHVLSVPLPVAAFLFSLLSLLVFTADGVVFWFEGGYWLSSAGMALIVVGAGIRLTRPVGAGTRRRTGWQAVFTAGIIGVFFASWLLLGGPQGPAIGGDPSVALLLQGLGLFAWLTGESIGHGAAGRVQVYEDPHAPGSHGKVSP